MDLATEQLDGLIERRGSREPDPDEVEPSYMASVRRFHARQRDELLWARLRHHEAMLEAHAKTFQKIIRRHKAALAECELTLGIMSKEDAA